MIMSGLAFPTMTKSAGQECIRAFLNSAAFLKICTLRRKSYRTATEMQCRGLKIWVKLKESKIKRARVAVRVEDQNGRNSKAIDVSRMFTG